MLRCYIFVVSGDVEDDARAPNIYTVERQSNYIFFCRQIDWVMLCVEIELGSEQSTKAKMDTYMVMARSTSRVLWLIGWTGRMQTLSHKTLGVYDNGHQTHYSAGSLGSWQHIGKVIQQRVNEKKWETIRLMMQCQHRTHCTVLICTCTVWSKIHELKSEQFIFFVLYTFFPVGWWFTWVNRHKLIRD